MESWLGATAAPSGPVLKIVQLKILKDPETFAWQVTWGNCILLNVICPVWVRMMATHVLRAVSS